MNKKRLVVALASVVVAYALLPACAGALKIGEPAGPIVYSKRYHLFMYRVAYAMTGHGKPRTSLDSVFYRRPLFYGVSPTLLSPADADQLFANINATRAAELRARYEQLQRQSEE